MDKNKKVSIVNKKREKKNARTTEIDCVKRTLFVSIKLSKLRPLINAPTTI